MRKTWQEDEGHTRPDKSVDTCYPMKAAFLATAILAIATPALARPGDCYFPPGSTSGTGKWASDGKEVEAYVTTAGFTKYPCGPQVKQNDPPKAAGQKKYTKQVCGPLVFVEETSYRPCTFEESAGISGGYGLSSRLTGALSKYVCAGDSILWDTRYELRDKEGQKFDLGTEYGLSTGGLDISETCTPTVKTKSVSRSWRVGTQNITMTTITEYQAEAVRQPSL